MQRGTSVDSARGRPGTPSILAARLSLVTSAALLAGTNTAWATGGDALFRSMARQEVRTQWVEFRDAAWSRVETYPLSRLRQLTTGPGGLQAATALQRAYENLARHEWVNLVKVDNSTGTVLEVAQMRPHAAPGEPPNPMGFTHRLRSPRLLEILFATPPASDAGRPVLHQELLRDWPPRVGLIDALYRARIGSFLLTNGGQPRWEVPADGSRQLAVVAFDHPAGLSGTRWRFWLDRRSGYRPVRWDILDSRGQLGWQHTISYRRYGTDNWFFSRYQWQSYYLGRHGARALRYTETHQALDPVFNPRLSPAEFKVPVSPGTPVVDQRYGLSYFQEGTREYSDRELLRFKRDPDLLQAEPARRTKVAAGPTTPWSWLLALLGVVLLFAGGYSHHRLFRSRLEPAGPGAGDPT